MRRYETVILTDPDLSDEDRDAAFKRVKECIESFKGKIVIEDEWGIKKLAYEIRKKVRAHYMRFDYCGEVGLVAELERLLRLDDRVMKYITVLLDKKADLSKIEQSLLQADDSLNELDSNQSTEFEEFDPDDSSSDNIDDGDGDDIPFDPDQEEED